MTLFVLITALFCTLIAAPHTYHDIPALRAGLVEGDFLYERTIYPTLQAIDYQGFVHE